SVAKVGPQQSGNNHPDNDEHTAHGRSSGFLLVGLGAILADVLADLEVTQTANDGRPDQKTDEKRSEAGKGSAKRQIAKNSERADMKDDKSLLVKQPIEQISRPESCVKA